MTKLIKIKLDKEIIISKLFKLSSKLNEIRELLQEKMSNNFCFLYDGAKVDKDDEKDISMEDIITKEKKIQFYFKMNYLFQKQKNKILQLENF